jgi:hypothetical protein
MMKPENYLTELNCALKEYRFQDIQHLTAGIDPTSFNMQQIKKALALLRRKRQFGELEHAAGLFTLAGHDEPLVRRQWAQALLDLNRVTQGIGALEKMVTQYGDHEAEGPEIRGLLGRAYKQLYVNHGGAENILKAIDAYAQDWQSRKGDYRWQGINLVALLERARRDGVKDESHLEPKQIARDILADLDDKGVQGAWDYATAMEASIALGDEPSALEWAKLYLHHPSADAFEIGSTLRQFRELWQLEDGDLGKQLLPVLEYALLQREGGKVEPLKVGNIRDNSGFEAVWGSEGLVYLQWLDTLYLRCNAIARISDSSTGAPQGTGFLMPGDKVCKAWGAAPVFVTNSHVISRNAADEAPLLPEDASVEFTRLPGRPKAKLGDLLFSSPRINLDVSILRIEAPEGSCTLEPYPHLPLIDAARPDEQRIYVIGHPNGNELAVSLYDNSLVEYEGAFVRYRSPTEAGNSGSPVFTKKLNTIAIHHRALDDKKLNEGILLRDIIQGRQA